MSSKIKFLLLVVLLGAVTFGLVATRRSARSQQDPPEPYTLRWRAQQALAEGKTELQQVVNLNYEAVNNLNDGLANYSLILVQPIDLIGGENDGTVGTWYKVRVVEQLTSRPPCAECPAVPDHPFGALASDELAIPRASGTLNVDGVTISTEESGFPGFLLTQKYLLFVNLDSNRKIATVNVGPVGAYMVDVNGTIVPVMQEANPLAAGMASSYGSSLAQLRAALGLAPSATPTPTPGSCNPSQNVIRHCEDNGGLWDYDTCTCN